VTHMSDAYDFRDRTLLDRDGEKIGKIDELYMDRDSGQPEWALVHTGMLGMKKHFVPLVGASPAGEDVRTSVTKDQVNDAPAFDADGELSEQEERRLFEHYGISYTDEGTVTAREGGRAGASDAPADAVGRDVSGPTTDDAMTRSEEELRVGTRERERGRVRLRKYVVTEDVQQTVPVRREEVRVEREAITDANVDAATSGPEISDEEHEVVLHEEEVVVEKRAVPKERVRLGTETTTDEEQISEQVRKERIDVDDARKRS
jgi:uncharacterized protein (TIGR02271 family)